MDPSSLERTPTVAAAVRAYVGRLALVPSAVAVPSKLDAYMFGPGTLPGAVQALTSVLEQLVRDVSGHEETKR